MATKFRKQTGILFFGVDVSAPSVLWMRRMLEGIGDDVAVLVTETDPGADYAARFPTIVVRDGPSRLLMRILRRLGVVESISRTPKAVRALVTALEADNVAAALVHYVTCAVEFRRVWARTRKPIFVHCHGWDVTWDMREGPPPGRRVHGLDYERRVRELPDNVRFISNSLRTSEQLRSIGIDDSRIHLKYLGVPVPPTRPRHHNQSEDVTILFLGRLIDSKGPEVVIRAFFRACDYGLRGRLIIAGAGPMESECIRVRASSRHAERVQLLGAVDASQGEALRAAADIFTAHNCIGQFSRQEEAFGVSVVEAMAAGLPIITGNSGSLPEIVQDGIQGFLVRPGDVDSHADCFLRLARDSDLRASMGNAGWQRARELFSIERELDRLRSILAIRG